MTEQAQIQKEEKDVAFMRHVDAKFHVDAERHDGNYKELAMVYLIQLERLRYKNCIGNVQG